MDSYFFGDQAGLAYQTTRWQRFLYELRHDAPAVQQGETLIADALVDDLMDHEGAELEGEAIEDAERLCTDQAHTFGEEVFGRLYGESQALPAPCPWAGLAHQELDQLPEFEALRASVDRDPDMAALATASLLGEIGQTLPELLEALREEQDDQEQDNQDDQEQQPEQQPEQGDAAPQAADSDEEPGQGEQEAPGTSAAAQEARQVMRQAMRQALRDASDEVTEAREALAGFLPGTESAPPSHEQGSPERLKLVERLLQDDRLRKVLRIAGKIERVAHKVRMVRTEDAYEEVVGIERGGDVARLLPSELVGLGGATDEIGELLELQTLARISERAALQYHVQGHERLGRGPIVMVMDESGSMDMNAGDGLTSLEWAKAIAIASLHTAVRERRSLALAGFDNSIREQLWISPQGEIRAEWGTRSRWQYDVPEYRNLTDAVWGILNRSTGGGTSFDAPLVWGLENGAESDRADIILLTDGKGYVAPATLERLQQARETKDVRVFGITVGKGSLAVMEHLCDDLVCLDRAEDTAAAVGGLGVH